MTEKIDHDKEEYCDYCKKNYKSILGMEHMTSKEHYEAEVEYWKKKCPDSPMIEFMVRNTQKNRKKELEEFMHIANVRGKKGIYEILRKNDEQLNKSWKEFRKVFLDKDKK